MASNGNSLIVDYVVSVVFLAVSLGIGILYSFKQNTAEEYVHGSHSLSLLPVSISMLVSLVSAISLQGIPAEVYLYGMDVVFALFAPLGILFLMVTFVPIFCELKLTSMFEYLEIRYRSRLVKLLACALNLFGLIVHSGVILFGPAAAVESLTGIGTEYNIIIMAVICTIYTSLGGIRAVIWVDVFQAFIMVAGLLIIIVTGFSQLGDNIEDSFYSLWYELDRRGHTNINLHPALTQRGSVWIFSIFLAVQKYAHFCQQQSMIRYTSLKTQRNANYSIIIATFGFIVLQSLSLLVGMVVFAYYSQTGCGPLGSKAIYTSNQIVPYFVIDVIHIPGLSGLFVSAIVASTLSSVSSSQNAFSGLFWRDFLCKRQNSTGETALESSKVIVLKVIGVVFGLMITAIAFIAMYLGGTLLSVAVAVMGVINSPPLGMFVLGACFTFPSAVSAIIGCLVSLAFCLWLAFGRLFYGALSEKPVYIHDNCNVTNGTELLDYSRSDVMAAMMTSTIETSTVPAFADVVTGVSSETTSFILLKFYSISSYCYPFLGISVTVIVGLIFSLFPKFRYKNKVNSNLLFPVTRKYVTRHDMKRNSDDFLLNKKT